MRAGAQLAITDLRQSTRFPVDFEAQCEHRSLGAIQLHIVNMSLSGFLVDNRAGTQRGDRVTVRLWSGRAIEALCLWDRDERAGFQFERPLRDDVLKQFVKQCDRGHSRLARP